MLKTSPYQTRNNIFGYTHRQCLIEEINSVIDDVGEVYNEHQQMLQISHLPQKKNRVHMLWHQYIDRQLLSGEKEDTKIYVNEFNKDIYKTKQKTKTCLVAYYKYYYDDLDRLQCK